MLTINGLFPYIHTSGYFCEVRSNVLEVLNGGNSSRWLSPSEATAVIQSAVSAAKANHAGQFLPTYGGPLWFGPYSCVTTGENVIIPPYDNPRIFPKNKTETGLRWKNRLRTSDIILTPHMQGRLRIDYVPGLELLNYFDMSFPNCMASESGLFVRDNKGYIVIGGRTFTDFKIFKAYRTEKRVQNRDPRPVGWNPKNYEYSLKGALASASMDNPMITSVLAKANSGTLDVLATLGEMPKTIMSIISAIKTIISMYKDARNKAFRIYNKGSGKDNLNTAWRNSKECAEAIAKVWMTWRFAIRPNAYLIDDCIEILYSEVREFIRYREFTSKEFKLPSPGLPPVSDTTTTLEHRCMIKRVFTTGTPGAKIMQHAMFNGAIALYELTPFSWLLDYFVNLGDVVAALFNNSTALAEGSTYSWKLPNKQYSFGSVETGFINITTSLYRRDVINPSDAVSISFNPDLTMAKYADIIALAWGFAKNEIPNNFPRRKKS